MDINGGNARIGCMKPASSILHVARDDRSEQTLWTACMQDMHLVCTWMLVRFTRRSYDHPVFQHNSNQVVTATQDERCQIKQ